MGSIFAYIPKFPARSRIDQAYTPLLVPYLSSEQNLKSLIIRVNISHNSLVRVTDSGTPQSFAVIVQHYRPHHNLVTAVSVQVGANYLMGSLRTYHRILLVAAPLPKQLQPAAGKLIGIHCHLAVSAAVDKDAGSLAVQVSNSHLVAVVAVIVAELHPLLNPIHPCEFRPAHTVENGKILGTFPVGRAALGPVIVIWHFSHHAARLVTVILIGRCGLYSHLSLAVSVQVGNHIGRVPYTLLYVPAEVFAPKEGAVRKVGFQLEGIVAAVPRAGVRALLRLLDDIVQSPVAIKVCNRHLLCRILALELDAQIVIRQSDSGLPRELLVAYNGNHLVNTTRRAFPVGKVGRGAYRLGVELGERGSSPGAIDVESYVCGIRVQKTPAHIHSFGALYGHDSPVELFGDPFSRPAFDFGLRSSAGVVPLRSKDFVVVVAFVRVLGERHERSHQDD